MRIPPGVSPLAFWGSLGFSVVAYGAMVYYCWRQARKEKEELARERAQQ